MSEEKQDKSEVYEFGDCVLDADRRELRVAGKNVTTQPKAFDLLLYLVRNRQRAIDKDELQNQLWPRSIVTETALTRCVMKARRAVNDDADRQAVIRTVHGHGYRFVADLRTSEVAEAAPATAAAKPSPRRRRPLAVAAGLVVAVAVAWWLLATPVHSETVRLAVLPVANDTGDAELDWARNGFMALINRMLEDRNVEVVSNRSVSQLADSRTGGDADSDFRSTLQKTTGFTHLLAASLAREGEVYRLSFEISSDTGKPERRTFVGPEPVQLVTQLVETAATIVTRGAPELPREIDVSDDDFINESYARAMNMMMEGRYDDAQRRFQVIIEEEPTLFWPRYEYALCARNLRDFDGAERQFITATQGGRGTGQPETSGRRQQFAGCHVHDQPSQRRRAGRVRKDGSHCGTGRRVALPRHG